MSRKCIIFLGVLGFAGMLAAQSATCVTSAVPPILHSEGLTERIGDIAITCNSVPNTTLTANFTVQMNTNITNRISTGNALTGIVFTIDSGTGPQAVVAQPILVNANTLTFNGIQVSFSPQGTATLLIAGVRVNASSIPVSNGIVAAIGINGAGFALTNTQLVVGRPERGLYAAFSSNLICAQNGSPLPSIIDFSHLITANTAFASTRVTEGFADAFGPKSAVANFNADSGQRIIIRYSGLTSDARLFVPDVIAGSSAVQPTAGGDFELPASGGAYMPTGNGSLLLARVAGANPNGAGGSPVYQPGPLGSGVVGFNSVSEIAVVSGTAYVVYEVVDANPNTVESAQFPTFLGLVPNGNRTASQSSESVFFAPQSTVTVASATEPLPRFAAIDPQPDCTIIGDCGTYLPSLSLDKNSIQFTAPSGGVTQQDYFSIHNTGGGAMPWQISITYGSGSGWLSVDPAQANNPANVRVYASPAKLAPGTYSATLTVDAGTYAGSKNVNVTFVVTAAAPVTPVISRVVNAASFAVAPAVPGSLTTIMGSNFAGKNISATFDGMPGTISFANGGQINLLVPAAIGAKSSTQLVVGVDGVNSAPATVPVAQFSPAIFNGAVLNQDWTPNDASHGTKAGGIVQIYATGLSGAGTITGHIHDRDINLPYYAGPAPGFPGVQQVNLVVPADLPAMTTAVYVCGTAAGSAPVCSTPVPLTIQ